MALTFSRRKFLRMAGLGGAGLLLAACGVTPTVTPSPTRDLTTTPDITPQPTPRLAVQTLGYYTGSPEAYQAVLNFYDYLSIVSVDVYAVQFDGSIAGADEYNVLAFTREHAIKTYACVSNYNSDPAVDEFDPALAHAAVVTHKDETIRSLVTLARDGGFDGINIDFEGLAYSENIEDDRASFNVFIQDLAGQLHALGLQLIVCVPGKTEDNPQDSWGYPLDLAFLGAQADMLQLMTYDEHGPWGEPGPVSGVDWVEACLRFTTGLVDPVKLLIGLPAYGYDWDLTASDPESGVYSAQYVSWRDFPFIESQLGVVSHWDSPSQSPYLYFTRAGHEHVLWYETPMSIAYKLALIAQYQLAGLSVWALGLEDIHFWQGIAEELIP